MSESAKTAVISFGMVVPTIYGSVLVNRYDTNQTRPLIQTGRSPHHDQIQLLCSFLQSAADDAVALDVGANFGLYSLAFAAALSAKNGRVIAFEAQRILAYMLGGTTALNGVENLFVHHLAVGASPGKLPIPNFDYSKISSFGSIEFGRPQRENIGQSPLGPSERQEFVNVVSLDSLEIRGVHLLKIDVEGMEEAVVEGGRLLIEREKPVLCIEFIKSDKAKLISYCKEAGYRVFKSRADLICVHREKQHYGVEVPFPEI